MYVYYLNSCETNIKLYNNSVLSRYNYDTNTIIYQCIHKHMNVVIYFY